MKTAMRRCIANTSITIHSFLFQELQVLTTPLQAGELNISRDMTKQLQYESESLLAGHAILLIKGRKLSRKTR